MNFIKTIYLTLSLIFFSYLPLHKLYGHEQETIHADRTKTINKFDHQGHNISRIEFDQFGHIKSTIDFNLDGTQTHTVYHTNGSKKVAYFGTNGKSSSQIEIDSRGKIVTKINYDTGIKTIYHQNGTQTIDQFDTDGKNISRSEIDVYGKIISLLAFHGDGTKKMTLYNKDKTQTINHFDIHGNNSSRIEIDMHGNPTWSITFNADKTQTTTTFNADKTQLIHHRDIQGKIIDITYIDHHGIQHYASAQLITAWHEAGHAISYIHNHSLNLIQHISIQPNAQTNTQGHVQSIQTYATEKSREELENQIISALCGGIAEQILFSQKMILNSVEILAYFAQPQYATDIELAYTTAKEIMMQSSNYVHEKYIEQKSQEIIVELYKRGYQFLLMHKHEVQKIAQELIKKEFLSSDETYNLINAPKPLMYFEEGPLPINFINDYYHRGHKK